MNSITSSAISKVPEITLGFWIIKILATTLGETGGDAVSMSMHLGYLVGSAIFAIVFVFTVILQISARRFRPWLYWLTIIATTTVGTTLADLSTRSLGIGYAGGTLLLSSLLMATLWIWHRAVGTISAGSVNAPKSEMFYWLTILFSQTLGTALGDWTADTAGVGFLGGALLFSALLIAVASIWRWTNVSRTGLFWAAFILTRPLGAVVGDLLDKPVAEGGLALSRYSASLAIMVLIALLIAALPQRAALQAH